MNDATITEAETRALLHQRPTWMLLKILEVTETTRDDMARADNALGVLAAVQVIDWALDELDDRYPLVMARWHGLDGRGVHVDLAGMYLLAYTEECAR